MKTALPVITEIDGVLVASSGSWSGYTDLFYQWQRCSDNTLASCSDIPSANSSSYNLTSGDNGQQIRVKVVASNGAGGTTVNSASYVLPSSMSSLALWLDASDSSTITSSSGSVSAWRSRVNGAYTATQPTAANQPSLVNSDRNGRSTISLDGTNDFLSVPSFVMSGAFSAMAVVNLDGAAGARILLEHSPDANSNDGMYWVTTSGWTTKVRRAGVEVGRNVNNASWLADGFWGQGSVLNGGTNATHVIRKNGSVQAVTETATGATGTANVTNTLFVGARGGTSLFTKGKIAEMIVFNSALSDADRTSIEQYLTNKWGL